MRTSMLGAFGALLVATANACGSTPSETIATTSQDLVSDPTTQRVLGFESASDWSILQGPGTLSASASHTQGTQSLQIANPTFTVVQGARLPTLGSVGSTLAVDFRLPAGGVPWGSLALSLDAPSIGLNNAWIAQVSLAGLPGSTFQTATFALPSSVVTQLASTYTDLAIRFTWNVPANAGSFLLDNVRFPSATLGDAGSDATVVDSSADGARESSAPDASDGNAPGDGGVASIAPRTVFGKPSFQQAGVNDVVGNRTYNPQGVLVDRNAHPNTVFVVDSSNMRVLGYRSLGSCSGGDAGSAPCTNNSDCPGGTCVISSTSTRNADIVIGQKDLVSATCNGDSTKALAPSASTLCLEPYPRTISPGESPEPQSMAIDSAHNLYVADKWNHRVLKYIDPFATNSVADVVYGQPNMTSGLCNAGLSAPTASTLCLNNETTNIHISGDQEGTGVDVSPDGQVWITDTGNHRVVRFPASGGAANLVLGQADLSSAVYDTAGECNSSLTVETGQRLCYPKVVRYDAAHNRVFVLDWKDGGNRFRVLVYNKPSSGDFQPDPVADVKLVGAPQGAACATSPCDIQFTWNRPNGLEIAPDLSSGFWLLDSNDHRAVEYSLSGTTATPVKVIGQPDFTSVGFGDVTNCATQTPSNDWCNMWEPAGSMGIDGVGNIYLAEVGSPRVLRFPASGAGVPWTADAILFPNQAKTSGANENQVDATSAYSLNDAKLVAYPSGSNPAQQLVVFDQYRVLFWKNYASASTGAAADGALYQSDLNSQALGGNVLVGLDSDSKGHVFIGNGSSVDVFQGPLTPNQATVASVPVASVPLRSGGTLPGTVQVSGVAYDEKNDALFVADTAGYRVVRISNPLGTPVIDLVLGQPAPNGSAPGPNRSKDVLDFTSEGGLACMNVQPDGFGHISQIKLDAHGNLYVVDATHEGWMCSNNRVVEYDAATIMPGTADYFCGALDSGCTTARKPTRYFVAGNPATTYPLSGMVIGRKKGMLLISPTASVWDGGAVSAFDNGPNAPNVPIGIGFDANNRMIMALDGYSNPQGQRAFYYANPEPTCSDPNGCYVPFTAIFPSIGAQLSDVAFDANENLVLMDQTWSRVQFYAGSDVSTWIAGH